MRSLFSAVVLPVVFGLLGVSASACSSDDASDPNSSSGGGGGATSCATDTRKDIYTQGLTKPAADLKVVMTDSAFTPSSKPPQPGQVQKGMNTITVEILDAADQPVDGVPVSLDLWMPDHAHGSAAAPVVTAKGGGTYEITNVWLPMAGLWRFTITVKQDNADKSGVFNFCLDG